MIIEVNVSNKIAKLKNKDAVAVCGNSDYVIRFNFDSEWDAYSAKTARFKYNGSYTDVVFTGTDCNMPVIEDAYSAEIGVFAGELHTTTPAYLPMTKSILCGTGTPVDPVPSVYDQIMEILNGFSATVEKTGGTATITIVDPEGTTVAEITDGAKGDKGDKGEPGAIVRPTTQTISLAVAAWANGSATVYVAGVTATNFVQLTPSAKTDADAWGLCGCFCTAQGTDSLTFTCVKTPTVAISLGVAIW